SRRWRPSKTPTCRRGSRRSSTSTSATIASRGSSGPTAPGGRPRAPTGSTPISASRSWPSGPNVAEGAVPASEPVRAAGAVPWRFDDDDRIVVLMVHRPRYDDWSFPKGKRDEGESDEDCARREVFEETGLRGDLGRELPA